MNFFSKSRPGQPAGAPQRHTPPGNAHPASAVAMPNARTPAAATGVVQRAGRQSNGLKEFLWQLDGIGHGHLLDLGPARQTTITFFIERGYKVYTEDFLATWKYFLDEEELRLKKLPAGVDRLKENAEELAKHFLETTLLYPD